MLLSVSDLVPHPRLGGTDLLPGLTAEEYGALRDSIESSGIKQPIVVLAGAENVILDGHHRWRVAKDLGMEEVRVVFAGPMDDDAQLRLGVSLNVARRQLSREQKREAIAALLKDDPKQSNRAIAKTVGADDKTVGSVRGGLEATAEIPQLDTRVGQDGRERPASKPTGTIPDRPTKEDGDAPGATDASSSGTTPIDIRAEKRRARTEVANSPWGQLSEYLTAVAEREPPRLSRDEIREAVAGDPDAGWYVTARIVRDFLNVVLEEVDANTKEAISAAS